MYAPPAYKPNGIDFSSDGGDDWGIDKWLSYGGPTARANADTESNDCVPDCANGHRTLAFTTIEFSGRVPCYGRSAYARFTVTQTSNSSVAPIGSGRDLTQYCGYVTFRPGVSCLVHALRAVGLVAQQRCFEATAGSTNRKIQKAQRTILGILPESERPAFLKSEQLWRKYRESSCVVEASIYAGGTYEPVFHAACVFDRDVAHLSDLRAERAFLER